MIHRILPLLVLALFLAGCSKNIQNEEAVRKGVMNYLTKRADLNLSAMNVQISNLNFRENEADAMVSIQLKGGEADQAMQMRYTLERKGNEWVVKERKEAGQSPHGGGMGMPSQSPEGGLPEGHPPVKK